MRRSTSCCHRLQRQMLLLPLLLTAIQVNAEPGAQVDERLLSLEALVPLHADELQGMRGRNNGDVTAPASRTTVMSVQQLEATVNGAVFNVDEMTTGAVTIGDGALENFSGVGLFNILTGNNNAVSASIGIAIHLE